MFKLVLSLALLSVALGLPHKGLPLRFRGGKIVGGVEANIEDFPYQVSFRYYDVHICGGSILDENTIVTAAHCTDGLRAARMSIMVGSEDIEKGSIHQVEDFIQHPDFDEDTIDFDVSILKLSTPITFSDKAAPIALQEDGEEVPAKTTGVISGWGGLFEGDEETPYYLRKTEVDVISHEDCQAAYPFSTITERMLCAKRTGRDSCQGDSGGPFVANNKLIGVVSWGIGCARPKYPGIYSKVSNLRQWIDANR